MSAVEKLVYSVEEYAALEEAAPYRSEFYGGEIFAMSGGTIRHGRISANLSRALGNQLDGTSCEVWPSDQRIRIPSVDLSTYPDASIICGDPEPDARDKHAIVNPRVLCEILSKSTERYDRGRKFDMYRELPTLHQYVLISQSAPHVELFTRNDDGSWQLRVFKGLDAVVPLESVGVNLSLSDVYHKVEFGPEDDDPQVSSSSDQSR